MPAAIETAETPGDNNAAHASIIVGGTTLCNFTSDGTWTLE